MRPALLCAPNVSEGRDPAVLEALVSAVQDRDGVRLIDWSADPDHNRAVLSYVGAPEAVLGATVALAETALARIDMQRHEGVHPRMGAVDVVPFVAVGGLAESEALEIAKRFGRHIGSLGVPVFYYERSAKRAERADLPTIRRGGYEGLAAKLKDPDWIPDEGSATFNPLSGATVTGVRPPLVRFNVNLATDDLEVAREIARTIRSSGGGLPYLRAIGLPLRGRGIVQVSMNLIRHRVTSIAMALEAVRSEAAGHGIEIVDTEILGDVPLDALVDATRALGLVRELSASQVIEAALLDLPETDD